MAIALENQNIGTPTGVEASASTMTLTTNQTIAAGSFIVLTIGWANVGVTLSSVANTGSSSLTWTIDKQGHPTNPAAVGTAVISAQAPSGLSSGAVITATLSGGAFTRHFAGSSWTGVATSSPVDTTAGPVGVSPAATGWTSGNLTIAAGSLIVATCHAESINSSSTTSAGTELADWAIGSAPSTQTSAYRIEVSGGSYAVAGAWLVVGQSCTNAAAYLVGAAADPTAGGGRAARPGRHRGRFPAREQKWF